MEKPTDTTITLGDMIDSLNTVADKFGRDMQVAYGTVIPDGEDKNTGTFGVCSIKSIFVSAGFGDDLNLVISNIPKDMLESMYCIP